MRTVSVEAQRTSGGRPRAVAQTRKTTTGKQVMYGELLCTGMTSYIVTSLYPLSSTSWKTSKIWRLMHICLSDFWQSCPSWRSNKSFSPTLWKHQAQIISTRLRKQRLLRLRPSNSYIGKDLKQYYSTLTYPPSFAPNDLGQPSPLAKRNKTVYRLFVGTEPMEIGHF